MASVVIQGIRSYHNKHLMITNFQVHCLESVMIILGVTHVQFV
jgi:hypothetical protein